MSIGSGSGIDHILIMATYVNRFERKETRTSVLFPQKNHNS